MYATTGEYSATLGYLERDMGRGVRMLGWVVATIALIGAAEIAAAATRRAKPDSRTTDAHALVASFGPLQSHDGRFIAQVVSYPAVIGGGGPETWVVRLRSRNGRRVAHARVAVDAHMPETGGRMVEQPRGGRYIGRGLYEVKGLAFRTPGWWNVALHVQHRGRTDSLAFNLIVPPR